MRTTGLGPLGAQSCFQFIRGWQWQAPARGECIGRFRETRRQPVGWVRREGCGDIFECVLAGPGVNTGSVVLKE